MTNQELFERLQTGDETARDELVLKNIGLVHHFSMKYKTFDNPACSYEDLLSAGTIGLMKAVDTFKTDAGIQFSTYAGKCILNQIWLIFRKISRSPECVSIEEQVTDKTARNAESTYRDLTIAGMLIDHSVNVEMHVENRDVIARSFLKIDLLTRNERRVLFENIRNGQFSSQYAMAKNLGISQPHFSRTLKRAQGKMRAIREGEM